MGAIQHDEVNHVAQAILTKVFQGNEAKAALCRHIAQVAVDAHHEWGDEPRTNLHALKDIE